MTIEESIEQNFDQIEKLQQEIVDVLGGSGSGKKVLELSQSLGTTPEMQKVMHTFSDPSAHEIDRFSMAKYFGQAMEGDVEKNMDNYIKYLLDWYGMEITRKFLEIVDGLEEPVKSYVKKMGLPYYFYTAP